MSNNLDAWDERTLVGNNTSGKGAYFPLPPGVSGWSWGAFLLNWLWAISNRVWIGLLALVPVIGWIIPFILGFRGREWAWQNKVWRDLNHFNRVQRLWSIWAIVLIFGSFLLSILAAVFIPAVLIRFQSPAPVPEIRTVNSLQEA